MLFVKRKTKIEVKQMLGLKRFQMLKNVCICLDGVEEVPAETMLGMVSRKASVKKLEIDCTGLDYVKPKTLKCLVGGLEVFVVSLNSLGTMLSDDSRYPRWSALSLHQVEAVYKAISLNADCKMKELRLDNIDHRRVSPSLIGQVAAKLETFSCFKTKLEAKQVEDLFHAISKDSSKLKRLNVGYNNLSTVPMENISRSLMNLVSLEMTRTRLTQDQLRPMFINLVKNDCKIVFLDLSWNNLSGVSPGLFTNSIKRMISAKLDFCDLTPGQLRSMLATVACQECKIKTISLKCNDLSSISPQFISYNLSKLNTGGLEGTLLSSNQLESVLNTIAIKEWQVSTLELSSNDFSLLPAHTLSYINSLTSLDLEMTRLTHDQVQAIFSTLAKQNCQITHLSLSYNNLSCLTPEKFSACISKLTKANLRRCQLTKEHIERLLADVINKNCKLVSLYVHDNVNDYDYCLPVELRPVRALLTGLESYG